MSEEKKELQLSGGFSLQPKDLQEAMQFAKLMADSELVPKDFRQKPGNVLIAVQMGAELGVTPMQAIQNIAVINGRPGIFGDLGKAILRSGGCRIEEDDVETIKKNGRAWCKITRPNGETITRTFSQDDAEKAGLWGKQGPWSQYPYRQMAWRAFWFAARDGAADLLKGMSGAEELRDIEPIEATTVPMPKRTESPAPAAMLPSPTSSTPAPATPEAPKPDPISPDSKPKATPSTTSPESDVEATVTIAEVKRLNFQGTQDLMHYKITDTEGVIYVTVDEDLAQAAKSAINKLCAISFKPKKSGPPVLTMLLEEARK